MKLRWALAPVGATPGNANSVFGRTECFLKKGFHSLPAHAVSFGIVNKWKIKFCSVWIGSRIGERVFNAFIRDVLEIYFGLFIAVLRAITCSSGINGSSPPFMTKILDLIRNLTCLNSARCPDDWDCRSHCEVCCLWHVPAGFWHTDKIASPPYASSLCSHIDVYCFCGRCQVLRRKPGLTWK